MLVVVGSTSGAIKAGAQPASKRARVDWSEKQPKKPLQVQASMPAMFQRDASKQQVSSRHSEDTPPRSAMQHSLLPADSCYAVLALHTTHANMLP